MDLYIETNCSSFEVQLTSQKLLKEGSSACCSNVFGFSAAQLIVLQPWLCSESVYDCGFLVGSRTQAGNFYSSEVPEIKTCLKRYTMIATYRCALICLGLFTVVLLRYPFSSSSNARSMLWCWVKSSFPEIDRIFGFCLLVGSEFHMSMFTVPKLQA